MYTIYRYNYTTEPMNVIGNFVKYYNTILYNVVLTTFEFGRFEKNYFLDSKCQTAGSLLALTGFRL